MTAEYRFGRLCDFAVSEVRRLAAQDPEAFLRKCKTMARSGVTMAEFGAAARLMGCGVERKAGA